MSVLLEQWVLILEIRLNIVVSFDSWKSINRMNETDENR